MRMLTDVSKFPYYLLIQFHIVTWKAAEALDGVHAAPITGASRL